MQPRWDRHRRQDTSAISWLKVIRIVHQIQVNMPSQDDGNWLTMWLAMKLLLPGKAIKPSLQMWNLTIPLQVSDNQDTVRQWRNEISYTYGRQQRSCCRMHIYDKRGSRQCTYPRYSKATDTSKSQAACTAAAMDEMNPGAFTDTAKASMDPNDLPSRWLQRKNPANDLILSSWLVGGSPLKYPVLRSATAICLWRMHQKASVVYREKQVVQPLETKLAAGSKQHHSTKERGQALSHLGWCPCDRWYSSLRKISDR